MAKWRIGCSGFHYKHWKGIFYPEDLGQSKWFNFYNQHFKTFELNVNFYRFPRLSILEPWYKESDAFFSKGAAFNNTLQKIYRDKTNG